MELTNKVAVITGASSGIGAATARNLNEVGVNLVLTDRRENRLVEPKKGIDRCRDSTGRYHQSRFAGQPDSNGFRNIAVAGIEPGLVQTEIFRDWDEFPSAQFDIPNPLQPEDIARVVRFILEQPDHVRIPRVLAIPADQEL